MNKKIIVGALGVFALVVIFGVVIIGEDAMAPTTPESNQTVEDTSQQNSNPNITQENFAPAGQYLAYSETSVQADAGEKILFFHAPWCPQCRQLDTQIKSNSLPAGTTIYKVDYDSNQTLRKKYGVTLQTTFVKIDNQGMALKKYVAYDEPTFTSLKENIL